MEQIRSRKVEKGWKIKVGCEVKKMSRISSGREHSALWSCNPNTTVQNYNQAGKIFLSLKDQGLLRLRNCVCCLFPAVCKELGCCSCHLAPGRCSCGRGTAWPERPGPLPTHGTPAPRPACSPCSGPAPVFQPTRLPRSSSQLPPGLSP